MPEATHPDGDDGSEGPGSVQVDLVSGDRMDGLTTMEKIRLILDGVHEGNIVILEQGLDPEEESKLIEVTMTEISPDEFTGIEIETYPTRNRGNNGFLGRFIGSDNGRELTVIGPADRIKTLHKDEDLISTLINTR